MKFSGAVTLGFVSCALALPANYRLSPHAGGGELSQLPGLSDLAKNFETTSSSGSSSSAAATPTSAPNLNKGQLAKLGQLFEKRGLTPSSSSATPSATPSSSGIPIIDEIPILGDLASLAGQKRGLAPSSSSATPSSSATATPTGAILPFLA